MQYLTIPLLSVFITITLIPVAVRLAPWLHALDEPNPRKIHIQSIPRTGGVAMAISVLFSFGLLSPASNLLRAFILGVIILVLIGTIDDIRGLGYKPKFLAQTAVALIMILYGGIKITSMGMILPDVILPDWVAIPLTLLAIVGVINAINLADGLDGLAGGITMLAFCLIGYLAYQAENPTILTLALAMIGTIFGFLRYNTFPAIIFMGDSGSQLLGFAAITCSLALTQPETSLSPLLPLIILGFPVLDTIYVMGSRILHGKSPFVGDKNHFHHKLIGLGFFHTEAVLIIYLIQGLLVFTAYVFRFYSAWFLLIIYFVFSVSILTLFYISELTQWKVKRYNFFDHVIKGRLKTVADKRFLIVVCMRIIKIGVPLLFLTICLLPKSVSWYFLFFSLAIAAIILATWFFKKKWSSGALRLIYLTIPVNLLYSEKTMGTLMTNLIPKIYNLSFGAIAFFVILTLKFTQRKKGFRFNPMDFLILFIALCVPFIHETQLIEFNLGLLPIKIIVLLFSYEVLLGELRDENKFIFYPTIAGLIVFIVRGFMG